MLSRLRSAMAVLAGAAALAALATAAAVGSSAGASAASGVAAASAAGAVPLRTPPLQQVSLLYVLNAREGTLVPAGAGRYQLALRVDPSGVWFSDRPARRSGTFPSSALATSWRGFGFAADPPNAALDVLQRDPDGDAGSTVILRLSRPRYARGWLRFDARRLTAPAARSNLGGYARTIDRTPQPRFGPAALFIDDASAPVVGSCILQPYAFCPGDSVESVDLANLDLTGADFVGTHMRWDRFYGATLVDADFKNAWLGETDFRMANLTGASLSGAGVYYSTFKGATGVVLSPSQPCQTTMPDGTLNPGDGTYTCSPDTPPSAG